MHSNMYTLINTLPTYIVRKNVIHNIKYHIFAHLRKTFELCMLYINLLNVSDIRSQYHTDIVYCFFSVIMIPNAVFF